MSAQLPTFTVPLLPAHWRAKTHDHTKWPWDEVTPLPALILADGSAPAKQQTAVRMVYDQDNFYLRFDCDDTEIWGIETARDSAIYEEEVVELFIAPGIDHPTFYYEFEVSPLGTMLDLTAESPNLSRNGLTANFGWDCPGLIWSAERNDSANHWRAYMVVPWTSIGAPKGELPKRWRANFYRIDRPRGQEAEFSCWSPTMSEPADYHRPAFFGYLTLASA